jgi:hypothetical protein
MLVALLVWSPVQVPGLWPEADLLGGLRTAPALGDERDTLDEVDVTAGREKVDIAGGRSLRSCLSLGGNRQDDRKAFAESIPRRRRTTGLAEG